VTRNDFYTVRVNGTEYKFEKGEVNEFNSARKKMSVIIKAPTLSLCGIEVPPRCHRQDITVPIWPDMALYHLSCCWCDPLLVQCDTFAG
jgi:hypothetical protein